MRKAQLEAYDGCARVRQVRGDFANQYEAVFTPSVADEAPVGIESTGDAVSSSPFLISFEYLLGWI
jgi:ADP-dependent phosphofructokinase/glucokinase